MALALAMTRLLAPVTPAATPPTDDVSSADVLDVAIARTPGGPGEWANWARVVKFISERLDRPVKLRYLTEEDKAAQVLAEDPADIAFVCAHTFLDLQDEGVMVGIASPLIDGEDHTLTLLVVREDSPHRTLEDLRRARFAVSERTSLGGYAFAEWLAKRDRRTLQDMFGEVRLGDTQEDNLKDLLAGEIDATVVNTAQVTRERLKTLRVIEQSPPLGPPPVVVSPEMDESTQAALLQALLDYDGSKAEEPSRVSGFEPLDDADYAFADELRRACAHHTADKTAPVGARP